MVTALQTVRKITLQNPDVWIFENYEIVEDSTLDEATGKRSGVMKVRGIFQKSETKNGNGRVYPDPLWERLVADPTIQERVQSRSMLGELEHPEDGKTDLNRVSHLITAINKNGHDILGEAEVFDTPRGLILQELFRRRARVGISSRGKGTSTMRGDAEVVNDDFMLETFDFVYNPSTPDAFPQIVSESISTEANNEEELSVKVQALQMYEGRLLDFGKLLTNATPADLLRYSGELTEMQVGVSKLMAEDTALAGVGQEILGEISEVKGKVKTLQVGGTLTESVPGASKVEQAPEEPAAGDDDDDDGDDDEPMEGVTPAMADMSCTKCRYTESIQLSSAKDISLAESYDCGKCGARMKCESVYRVREGLACPQHPELQMELAQEGEYRCPECNYKERLVETFSKGELVRRYMAAANLAKKLSERCRMYKESNETLRVRYESAVQLMGETVEKSERSAVASYVSSLLGRFGGLKRIEPQLRECVTVTQVQERVKEYLPLLKQMGTPKTESKTKKPKVDPTLPMTESAKREATRSASRKSKQLTEAANGDGQPQDEGVALFERISEARSGLS